jgi:signal transduction histidine kinase
MHASPAPSALLPAVPDYVTALAHDLRSPLTSVLFLVDSLRSGSAGPLTAAQKRQLNLVYVAAFGLCSVANDLLEASRAQDPTTGIIGNARPVAFSVAETLYGVRDIVLPIAEEKNVELLLETPAVDGRIGYPAALGRVLLNLVSNALREAEDGRVEITARDVGDEHVEYRVSDTGPGIAPEMLARLFEPVRSARSQPREAFCSAGLGLAICRRLVEAMGGELHVESHPGRGTSFVCTLSQPSVPSGRAVAERVVTVAAHAWADQQPPAPYAGS